MKSLLCLGYGACARALTPSLQSEGWNIIATTRDEGKARQLQGRNITPIIWQDQDSLSSQHLPNIDALLISISPQTPLLADRPAISELVQKLHITQAIYLSATSVYGDAKGAWVDEASPLNPTSARGKERLADERAWKKLFSSYAVPLCILRLAGIYGPERNQVKTLQQAMAAHRLHEVQLIHKPGHVFNRIHVDDISQAIRLILNADGVDECFNLADGQPAPSHIPLEFAAELLQIGLPTAIDIENASLSAMSREFYADNKRVNCDLIKQKLGWAPLYPSWREGLKACLSQF